jgi:sugar O-acyltransferase (sialic acid O-acetyltransferase NeuD family)
VNAANPLIIVGAGGLGREVAWLARSLPEQWKPIGFLDDDERLQGQSIADLPVLGKISDWARHRDAWLVIAMGAPRSRRAVAEAMEAAGNVKFATLVDPSVRRSVHVDIGQGTLICANSVLTTQVLLGRHCLVNAAATIGHDVRIGDYCTIGPQAALSGNVSLGSGVEIGTATVLLPGVTIGEGSVICAGAVVSKPVASNILAAGSPARRVKHVDSSW